MGDGQPAGFHLFSPERLTALIATVPSTHHGSLEKSTYRTQLSTDIYSLPSCNLRVTYKVASLPRLVIPAKVPNVAAQLQGMFGTP